MKFGLKAIRTLVGVGSIGSVVDVVVVDVVVDVVVVDVVVVGGNQEELIRLAGQIFGGTRTLAELEWTQENEFEAKKDN